MGKKKQQNFKKFKIRFWVVFLAGFFSVSLIFLLASMGFFGTLPTFEELENPEKNLATEVISSDGVTLGKYAFKNRTPVGYSDLSEPLVKALIATEDERFYDHSGIDFRGLARAIVKLGKGGGASTITQQLAKNLFTKRASSNTIERLMQKVKEWIVAIKLERQYTKNEIIAMYLNTQEFLFNAIGIRSAARIYFGKEPIDLDIQESAILVAMLKNPRQYNPNREISKGKSLRRRNVVFAQMEKNEFITQQEKDSLQQLPLKINFTPESHNDGLATYFREHLRKMMKEWVKKNPKPNGELYNINRDGLKIYVTLDSRIQQYAQEAVQEHLSNLQGYFFKEQAKNEIAPFYDLEEEQIEMIYNRAVKNSDRYKRMKKVFTFPFFKWLFKWLHPDLGVQLGQYLSVKNKLISGDEDAKFLGEENEWLVLYCKRKLEKQHYDFFVFGHRHLPLEIEINPKSTYINLGDWIQFFTYGEFMKTFKLKKF